VVGLGVNKNQGLKNQSKGAKLNPALWPNPPTLSWAVTDLEKSLVHQISLIADLNP